MKGTGCVSHGDATELKHADLDITLMSVRRNVRLNGKFKLTPRILKEAFVEALQVLSY